MSQSNVPSRNSRRWLSIGMSILLATISALALLGWWRQAAVKKVPENEGPSYAMPSAPTLAAVRARLWRLFSGVILLCEAYFSTSLPSWPNRHLCTPVRHTPAVMS